MDIEKLHNLCLKMQGDLLHPKVVWIYKDRMLYSAFKQLIHSAERLLPDYAVYFKTFWEKSQPMGVSNGISTTEALKFCEHLLELISEEKKIEKKINKGKLFQGAEDKLNDAISSFKQEDWSSTMNNLNTAIELAIKSKLEIPVTITKINTNRIIEILVKHGLGPVEHLKEVKKHVVIVDNKIKHQGYIAEKIDCVNAIKAVEEMIPKLNSAEIKLTEEIKNKIYRNL